MIRKFGFESGVELGFFAAILLLLLFRSLWVLPELPALGATSPVVSIRLIANQS
jgi:hypothetical protein